MSTKAKKKKTHPFIAHWNGWCIGKQDGCKTTFNAVVALDQLLIQGSGTDELVEMKMILNGRCVHIKGKEYSSLRCT